MTITTETISCVSDVWSAISEAAQEADAHGLTMLKNVARKFDNLCDDLIDQAGGEGADVYRLICNTREFGRTNYHQEDKARRSELLNG